MGWTSTADALEQLRVENVSVAPGPAHPAPRVSAHVSMR